MGRIIVHVSQGIQVRMLGVESCVVFLLFVVFVGEMVTEICNELQTTLRVKINTRTTINWPQFCSFSLKPLSDLDDFFSNVS